MANSFSDMVKEELKGVSLDDACIFIAK